MSHHEVRISAITIDSSSGLYATASIDGLINLFEIGNYIILKQFNQHNVTHMEIFETPYLQMAITDNS